MLCFCGGTLEHKAGAYARGGTYSFYGCNKFPECEVSMPVDQFEELNAKGVSQIEKEDVEIRRRNWVRSNHRRYDAKQRQNPNKIHVPLRAMTQEQEAFIEAIEGMPHIRFIMGNADAGVGKTSTALQAAARTRKLKSEDTTGMIMAFGRKNADELSMLLPYHWVGATVHSIGNSVACAEYGLNPTKQNKYKTRDILRVEYGKASMEDRPLYTVVEHLVSMCKAMAFNERTATDDNILQWAQHYNKDIGSDPSRAFDMVRNVLRISRDPSRLNEFGHNFDDMCWLPVINNLKFPTYRYVGVDEGQDSARVRMLVAIKSLARNGKLFVIGDTDQAIFGFTCADTQSMETFKTLLSEMGDVHEFGITINWRCPADVIALTQIIHPSIKARPGAPKGYIHEINDDTFFLAAKPGDVVLCRVNADLISAAYKFIKNGRGAVVLGRDIATNLKNLIIKLAMNPDETYCSVKELIRRAGVWFGAECEVLSKKNVRNPDEQEEKLYDEYQCVVAVCGAEVVDGALKGVGQADVPSVLRKIDMMFGEEDDKGYDPKRVITLSTVHKMKGGQAARIFILRAHELHPHPAAKSEWEMVQEKNILYVAITRTGNGTSNEDQRLFFVGHMPSMLRDHGGEAFISPFSIELTGVERDSQS